MRELLFWIFRPIGELIGVALVCVLIFCVVLLCTWLLSVYDWITKSKAKAKR